MAGFLAREISRCLNVQHGWILSSSITSHNLSSLAAHFDGLFYEADMPTTFSMGIEDPPFLADNLHILCTIY